MWRDLASYDVNAAMAVINDSRSSDNATWPSSEYTDSQSTVTVFDTNEYLAAFLGCRYRNGIESTTLTIVYLIVLLTGVVGNVTTCVVVVRNKYMHTATNYYLVSLAVSDALALVLGLPPELYTVWEAYPWRFGEPYCLFKTFLTELLSSASVLTITAFTVERYVAICHPLRAQRLDLSNPSRVVKVILLIWLAAGLAALPYPVNTRTYHYVHHPTTHLPLPDSLVCNIPLEWMPSMKYVIQVSTVVLFVVPMCAMTALYIAIALAIRKSVSGTGSRGRYDQHHGQTSGHYRQTAVRRNGQRNTSSCRTTSSRNSPARRTVLKILGILYYVSSTINPILYNLMSLRYRQAFRDTLCSLDFTTSCLSAISAACRCRDAGRSASATTGSHRPAGDVDVLEMDGIFLAGSNSPSTSGSLATHGPQVTSVFEARNVTGLAQTKTYASVTMDDKSSQKTRSSSKLINRRTGSTPKKCSSFRKECRRGRTVKFAKLGIQLTTWNTSRRYASRRPVVEQSQLTSPACWNCRAFKVSHLKIKIRVKNPQDVTNAGRRQSDASDNSEAWVSGSPETLAAYIRDEWL